YLHRAIARGRPGTTMSAWGNDHGGPLSNADIDAVVALLRSWDHGPRGHLDARPPAGNAARGEAVFAEECAQCHGDRGVGGENIRIGSADFLTAASTGFLRDAIRKGRLGTSMPGFEDSLGNDRIEDVVALLRTLQSPAA